MDESTHIHKFMNDIKACDCAFGVEPAQTNLLFYIANMVKKKPTKITLMPHPVDTKWLDTKWRDYQYRRNSLAFHYHKYDGHLDIPWLLTYGLDCTKYLFGYTKTEFDVKECPQWFLIPFTSFEWYIETLATCKFGFEYRTHKAASRFIMEAAGLGIPVVSTHDSYMGMCLFPEICHPVEDFASLRNSLELLVTDDDKRIQLARNGIEKLDSFNFESSAKSMERLLE
jgi:hypothetical protein